MHPFWTIAAVLAATLGGCSGDTKILDYITPGKVPDLPKLEPGVYPTRYKSDVADLMRTEMRVAIRDAYIGEPVLRPVRGVPHYVTCVRYGIRDSNNRDTGSDMKYIIFLGGIVNQFLPGDPELCGGLNYQRLPDVEVKLR